MKTIKEAVWWASVTVLGLSLSSIHLILNLAYGPIF